MVVSRSNTSLGPPAPVGVAVVQSEGWRVMPKKDNEALGVQACGW